MTAASSHPLPSRPSALQLFRAFDTSARRWPGALRAALAILIPGAIANLTGHSYAVLLVAAGAFAVIYGEGYPYRTRRRVILTAGALIVVAATVGAFVGELVFAPGHGRWWLLVSAAFSITLAATGSFVQNALRLPPPGSFMIVMVAGGSTMLARTDIMPWQAGVWSLAGVATAYLLGMAPRLRDPHGPETRSVLAVEKAARAFENASTDVLARHHQAQTALYNAWQALADAGIIRGGRILQPEQAGLAERVLEAQARIVAHNQALDLPTNSDELSDTPTYVDPARTAIPHTKPTMRYRFYRAAVGNSHATITAEKIIIAATLTAVLGVALGLDRPDWGAVSVLLVLQWGPDRIPGTIRGVHRMLGSALGVGLFSLIAAFGLQEWTLLIALAACQYCAEIFVVKNYALCVIFSTPLALLMGNSSQDLGHTVTMRICEIALSVLFALAVLWLWKPGAQVTNHYRLQARCEEAMQALLGALLLKTPDESLALRRDLQYELLSERRSVQSIAVNKPDAIKRFWPRHVALQHAGYFLLDFCSVGPDARPTREELDALIREVRAAQA
ncbi:FUSC family protein [Corynebacterium sp.]|uniref:FUSC family protein n=1 Tax=Corynebacterium sp. TaxID=1720 RepID=UPI0026DACA92|nr:FUSC family protein [Corynebacterium sp.]MDO5031064.1 FUSC family protein [Corynebacterium sp.]